MLNYLFVNQPLHDSFFGTFLHVDIISLFLFNILFSSDHLMQWTERNQKWIDDIIEKYTTIYTINIFRKQNLFLQLIELDSYCFPATNKNSSHVIEDGRLLWITIKKKLTVTTIDVENAVNWKKKRSKFIAYIDCCLIYFKIH